MRLTSKLGMGDGKGMMSMFMFVRDGRGWWAHFGLILVQPVYLILEIRDYRCCTVFLSRPFFSFTIIFEIGAQFYHRDCLEEKT